MKHTQTSPAPEGATPAPRGDALSASSIFGATLLRCAEASSSPDTPATSFCWLLAMGRQLGLPDDELVALALPYPRLADLLRRQIDQLSARAAAARSDERDEVNLAIAAYLQHIASCPYDQETRLTFCRALLDRGANVEAKSKEKLYSALHYAALGDSVSALRSLLATQASRDVVDAEGNTPLHHAPQCRHRWTSRAVTAPDRRAQSSLRRTPSRPRRQRARAPRPVKRRTGWAR